MRNPKRCWLRRCTQPWAKHLQVNGYELKLCTGHAEELERNADAALGYSSAAPAKGYSSHWPWRLEASR